MCPSCLPSAPESDPATNGNETKSLFTDATSVAHDNSNGTNSNNTTSTMIPPSRTPTGRSAHITTSLSPPETLTAPHPNPSLQVTADHQIKMVDAPVYSPGPTQVLLQIKALGICGSDVHFWRTGRIGSLIVESDCILGHEAAGVVVRLGSQVKRLKVGDRVAVEPGVPCGSCYLCAEGRYNLCEEVRFAGVWPDHGAGQRWLVHEERWCHKLPPNIPFSTAALLEPLSVVLHGIKTASLSLGRGCLIHGAGPIGLIALAAARASGAHPLVITDLEQSRLDFAKEFVPSCQTYLVARELGPEENARSIRGLFTGEREGNGNRGEEYFAPHVVLECTGVESSICTGIYAVRRGGVVMVIGVGRPVINNIPFMHMSLAEIDLRFINRYRDTWPAGLACLSGGVLNLDKLVTHTFPLERAKEALEFSADLKNGSIKVQIVDEVDGMF